MQGLASVGYPKGRGLLLLAQMSADGNLLDAAYTQACLKLARQFPTFVIGFIALHRLDNNPTWLHMTPGVHFSQAGDSMGQQYATPERAILENGTDIIIVGRGICQATDPLSEARRYREASWTAYQTRLQQLT